MADALNQGRDAHERHAWADAYDALSTAAGDEPLGVDDLERLATAAYLTGRAEAAYSHWSDAHQQHAQDNSPARAARCAFWIAFGLINAGEPARGGGWVDRAQRLLDDTNHECVELGHLKYAVGLRSIFEGDGAGAHAGFTQAVKIGDRFGDPEITALARIGQGRCLIYMGDVAGGVALLDEALVAVGASEVSPIAVGDAYCTVIDACQELYDLQRVQEWTSALSDWCDAQPQIVLYRGNCLVHRAEIMSFRGEWSEAILESQRACDRLADPANPMVLAAAIYLRAELHRLRGQFGPAADDYRRANELGRDPQPGLALLRLAEGNVDAAAAAIRRVVDEADDPITRARVLGPYVEIMLADGDVDAAGAGVDELSAIAAELDVPFVRGVAAYMSGAVLIAAGAARDALALLRSSWTIWREMDAPYEAARARVLIALACRGLGDDDSAEMELDAARATFAILEAGPDVERVDRLSVLDPPKAAGGLTAREIEVLRLVAKGKTNRAIADELVVSEKTVASHLSHIFTKLDLTSRAGATAYAYEKKLI